MVQGVLGTHAHQSNYSTERKINRDHNQAYKWFDICCVVRGSCNTRVSMIKKKILIYNGKYFIKLSTFRLFLSHWLINLF